jgi:predicted naringenin-chalcone synthase
MIQAIGTATPEYRRRQSDVAAFMKKTLKADRALARRIDYLYQQSGIDARYSCIPDYGLTDPAQFQFYPPAWDLSPFPTTQQRLTKYQAESLPLCLAAIANALNQPNAPNLQAVTHLIVVSCTGFYAPGLDVLLVKTLGLSPQVKRTLIGFMGCYAAFNGMRTADVICKSDPEATVLLVCVELCSLHFQNRVERAHLISNCIFADGAAAAFFKRKAPDPTAPSLVIANDLSWIDDDSLNEMTWLIGDAGFEMHISSTVPEILQANLPKFIQRLLQPAGLEPDDIGFWAIHPGGKSILERVQKCFDLPDHKLKDSRAVLREYGNMSSPTVLFVLKRLYQRLQRGEDFRRCVAMAFGPGLTFEGCLLQAEEENS